jgi:transposase, IS5 family
LKDKTMYKAQRNRPLTKQQQNWNRGWAKTRARVEHCFARIHEFRGHRWLHCVGLARARVQIGLINMAHNLRRLASKHKCAMRAA